MTKRQKIFSIVSAIVVVALFALTYYYFFSIPKAHLILGVPYYGIFSGTILANDIESSVAMILGYWRDERLSLEEIGSVFGSIEPGTIRTYSWDEIKSFFISRQYDVELKQFKDISEIVRFISVSPEVPLLTTILNIRGNGFTSAVLIGADPRAGTITVHQTAFGNNYILSVSEAVFPLRALIVKPGSAIQSSSAGPNHNVAYPKRLGIMDDSDIRGVNVAWIEAQFVEKEWIATGKNRDKALELIQKWEAVIAHPGFEKIYPAGRVLAYSMQAYYAIELGEYDLAISLLREKAIPLNRDFNKPYGEWPRDPSMHERSTRPWLFLEKAYAAKGDLKNAQEAREERLKILRERGE